MARWIVFLAAFLIVYGTLHGYVLIKLRRALHLEGWIFILAAVILAFLMIAPIHGRLLSGHGYPTLGPVTIWAGYVWMGYIFIFVCIAGPLDLYHLCMSRLQQLFNADWTGLMLMRRQNLMLAGFAAAVLMAYGAFSAYRVGTEQVTLYSNKIPAHVERIRIVQISDLHLGTMFYPRRLSPILEAVRQAQPDILVSTGDLVDGDLKTLSDGVEALKSLPASLGRFAVTGNHEYYHGITDSIAQTEKAGFQLLRNTAVVVQDLIAIAGVDDPAGGSEPTALEEAALSSVPQKKFTILLKHRPQVAAGESRFDLQLSGHTHKGQIFPFRYFVGLAYPMMDGLYEIGPERYLYTSRGTGTWGPPVRLLAPPEITIIDLKPMPKK